MKAALDSGALPAVPPHPPLARHEAAAGVGTGLDTGFFSPFLGGLVVHDLINFSSWILNLLTMSVLQIKKNFFYFIDKPKIFFLLTNNE